MAEYKNGFSALGNVPISPDRRSSDLQTGRAVYVDEADYSADAKYKDKVDTVENEGYHREAPIVVPEKGSSGGGGGSSDFSTAQVRVILQNGTTANVCLPFILNDSFVCGFTGMGDETVTAYLKDGSVTCMIAGDFESVNVSGNASVDEDYNVIITGDCTITIS